MTRIAVLAGTAVAALALVASSSATSGATKLQGDVGPGFTIHLKKAGKTVTKLTPGSYSITVADRSNIHNFHLKGPGVNREITTVGFVGTKTIIVRFKKGLYTFVCDPHLTSMKGSFRVL